MTGNLKYLAWADALAPRVLSQIDRDPDSPTYGCCDRNFWHYKIRDFPSAILQQSCLGLLSIYESSDSEYYQNQNILESIEAIISYWNSIQHRDGSFDEYFPSEHSIPPTVFSTFAVSECVRKLKITDSKVIKSLHRAAKYLSENREEGALNQEVASVAALYSLSLTLKSKKYEKIARIKKKWLLKQFVSEGWFPEYGGADIGYLSVSLNYLGEYYHLSKDKEVEPLITSIVNFLSYFTHPDGSFGGDYGARNTEYFLPAGFEIANSLQPKGTLASAIADQLYDYAHDNYYIDDRYLMHYVFSSIARAQTFYKDNRTTALPYQLQFVKDFPIAGMVIVSSKKHYAIISAKKGGAMVVFEKSTQKRLVNDCGYRAKMGNELFVSNWINNQYDYVLSKDELLIQSRFFKTKFRTPSPLLHMGLRVLSRIFKQKLTPLLKSIMIHGSKISDIALSRKISLSDFSRVDTIESPQIIDTLTSSSALSLRYCPSSRYFQSSSLTTRTDSIVQKNKNSFTIKRRGF